MEAFAIPTNSSNLAQSCGVPISSTTMETIQIIALVLVSLAVVFRKQLMTTASFLSSSAHAFAKEYNDVYTEEDTKAE